MGTWGRGCQVEGTACVQSCVRKSQWSNVPKVRSISMRMLRDEVREVTGGGADTETLHGPLQRLGLLFWEKWRTTRVYWAKKQCDLIFCFKGSTLTTGWRISWWKVSKNRSKETSWNGDLVQNLRSGALDMKDPNSDSGLVKPKRDSPLAFPHGLNFSWPSVWVSKRSIPRASNPRCKK